MSRAGIGDVTRLDAAVRAVRTGRSPAGQPDEQHHGGRVVLQQLVRAPQHSGRHRGRRTDLARRGRADSDQRRAVRRAAGELHRRGREHRHAQRHEQDRGSFYHAWRNDGLVGKKAGAIAFNPGTFSYGNTGVWGGGPIERNKLFFFVSYEDEAITQPGTIFNANTGGQPVIGNTTRVLQSDLDALSSFVQTNFNYTTGVYQGFDTQTPAKRLLIKGDYNLNDRNKISFRYTHLDAVSERPVSTSSSLGFGRPLALQSMTYANSYYGQMEKIKSGVGEWNSILGASMSNSLIIGYTKQDESREPLRGDLFPFVDILDANTAYISFGAEPFTPNNELRYNTFQIQNNLQKFGQRHSFTFGVSYEKVQLGERLLFWPAERVHLPLAGGFLHRPERVHRQPEPDDVAGDAAPVPGAVNNLPGVDKPVQPLEVDFVGGYIQDDWRFRSNVRIIAGFRMERSRCRRHRFRERRRKRPDVPRPRR